MKTVLFCALITSVALAQVMAPPPRQDLVRIELVSPEQTRLLDHEGVVINEVHDDCCIAEASPELLAQLAVQGYQVTVLTEDVSGVYFHNSLTRSPTGQYLTYQQFRDTLGVIAVNNASICKLETLAPSASGNLVLAMKLAAHPRIEDTTPQIYFEANVHGDEKIGWAVDFEFLKYLVRNYGINPEVTNLINTRQIWLTPMLNPDGYSSGYRENGHSVDMNRNWGWMWGEEFEPGSNAMSESEIQGDIAHLMRHNPTIFVSYHAGTECIPYPWSYTDYDTIPENHAIDWLSAGYSNRGNNYQYGQGSIVMYLINGSSKDFGYGVIGDMAWSIEVNYTKTPPASEIDTTFIRNRDAMLFFCHEAGLGIHGFVTDSVTGLPLHAQIWLQPANWQNYTSPANGDFHRFCLPGTYGLVVACPGYLPKTLSGITVPASGDSSVAVNVQLTPDPGAPLFGFRVVACSCVTDGSNQTCPVRALGVHDGSAYTLGNGKGITIDMERPIRDTFTVYRSSGSGNGTVYASDNWTGSWTQIGTANAAQTSFSLRAAGLDSARYVYLKASGSFGFDAVEAIQFTGIAAPRAVPAIHPEYRLNVAPSLIQGSARVLCAPAPVGNLRLEVYDIQGRQVQGLTLRAGEGERNLGLGLCPGVYFLRPVGEPGAGTRFAVVR